MQRKISQHVVTLPETKKRSKDGMTKLYHAAKKPALFSGHQQRFEKTNDEAEDQPDDVNLPDRNLRDDIKEFEKLSSIFINGEATLANSNEGACADIVMPNGDVLAESVPVTALLSLHGALADVRSYYEELPTLRPGVRWDRDEASGQFWTPERRTSVTKKCQRPIVLYDATEHHPAQTQLVTEDVKEGERVKQDVSTAITESEKSQMLDRINALIGAVKEARERANDAPVKPLDLATPVFAYLNSRD